MSIVRFHLFLLATKNTWTSYCDSSRHQAAQIPQKSQYFNAPRYLRTQFDALGAALDTSLTIIWTMAAIGVVSTVLWTLWAKKTRREAV